MPPVKIEIGAIEATLGIVVIILVAGIAWGTLKTLVQGIKKTLEEIKPDLKDTRERLISVEGKVDTLEGKVDTLWRDNFATAVSPRQLNDHGNRILNESGMKEIISEKKSYLFEMVKKKGTRNAYDAEQEILSTVEKLTEYCPDIIDRLKTGAFNTGSSIEVLLLVGGIHLRDLIFDDLGFSLTDLDKTKTP